MVRSSRSLTCPPLLFVDKTPDGAHQMEHRDVNTALPENLRDRMDAGRLSGAPPRSRPYTAQSVDLGLLAVAAAFRAAGDLKKILGSGFEMIRISQGKSARVSSVL